MRTGLEAVDVEIRAEVASRHMPVEEVLALKPGDVLRFRVPAAEGVTLCAGHVPAHRGQPGRNGNWRAVQVIGRAEVAVVTTEEALIRSPSRPAKRSRRCSTSCSQSTVERSKVAVVHADDAPLRSIPVPAVVSNVSYIHGVTGGNIFVMTRLGVQRLAAAMMGMDAAAVEEAEELSELDLSAAGEAMNQMMAAAARRHRERAPGGDRDQPAGDAVLRDAAARRSRPTS